MNLQPTVALFGHTAELIQQAQHEAPARVWLVARAADAHGSGRVSVDALKAQLVSSNDGGWSLMTGRRFRQILAEGEGIYWQRGHGRGRDWLYYRSEARVLHHYGATAVHGYAVAIPVHQLNTRSIRPLRTLLYDAAHSARTSLSGYTAPVARETIEAITGTSAQTQRQYEAERGIVAKSTFAILGRYDRHALAAEQAFAGERPFGGPAFAFVDFHDRLRLPCSPANTTRPNQRVYLARQLPNTYSGTLNLAPRSKRHTNYRLNSLRHDAVKSGSQSDSGNVQKRYFALTDAELAQRRTRRQRAQGRDVATAEVEYTGATRVNRTHFFLEKRYDAFSAVSVGVIGKAGRQGAARGLSS